MEIFEEWLENHVPKWVTLETVLVPPLATVAIVALVWL